MSKISGVFLKLFSKGMGAICEDAQILFKFYFQIKSFVALPFTGNNLGLVPTPTTLPHIHHGSGKFWKMSSVSHKFQDEFLEEFLKDFPQMSKRHRLIKQCFILLEKIPASCLSPNGMEVRYMLIT